MQRYSVIYNIHCEDYNGSYVLYSDAIVEIDRLKKELEDAEGRVLLLTGEVASLENAVCIEWEQAETAINKLSALTAMIESDDVAEQVASKTIFSTSELGRASAIHDYRKMLREGL